MNNLNLNRTHQSPFSFLAEQPKKPANNGCGLAWLDDSFHLRGNNYYLYTCSACQRKQVKKGKLAKEVLNWGGRHV